MNKKTIKLGILLVFIFSCNVSTSNNNVEVKPTTSVSLNTSVLPTVTPTIESTPSPIPSPTITPTPTAIATPYVEIINFEQNFQLNKERDGIENGYDGKVLIIIDTYLLKEYIESEEELNRMKRKVMILKDSYDKLSEYEKEQLKKEYGDYTIFDPNIYKPIKESDMKKNSTYEGELSLGTIGFKFNNSIYTPVYRGIYCYTKDYQSLNEINLDKLNNSFSVNLKSVYQNIKISNKKKLMKAPIQKMVFCSISALSYYSDAMSYTVTYFDYLSNIVFEEYSIPLVKKSDIWRVF
jgi:hypothetical protein